MQTTIQLPDEVYREGERIARAEGFTLEQLIVRTLEREFFQEKSASPARSRVILPLIHSKEPGTLDLSNFNFDDLLA
ncbi:MAG TPA: hypothetical protein VH325_14875 [Bryobacteraceae bacterium]|jgi:hypothetical protein|nr:hypothetical protein [Bryobacteraceae bacterium]